MALELNYDKMGMWDKRKAGREWYTDHFADLAQINVHNGDGVSDGSQWTWSLITLHTYNANEYYDSKEAAYRAALDLLERLLANAMRRVQLQDK